LNPVYVAPFHPNAVEPPLELLADANLVSKSAANLWVVYYKFVEPSDKSSVFLELNLESNLALV
jgi:hypothetical protein